jgi:hypothetical protein
MSDISTAMASISRGVGQQKHQPLPTSADFQGPPIVADVGYC